MVLCCSVFQWFWHKNSLQHDRGKKVLLLEADRHLPLGLLQKQFSSALYLGSLKFGFHPPKSSVDSVYLTNIYRRFRIISTATPTFPGLCVFIVGILEMHIGEPCWRVSWHAMRHCYRYHYEPFHIMSPFRFKQSIINHHLINHQSLPTIGGRSSSTKNHYPQHRAPWPTARLAAQQPHGFSRKIAADAKQILALRTVSPSKFLCKTVALFWWQKGHGFIMSWWSQVLLVHF